MGRIYQLVIMLKGLFLVSSFKVLLIIEESHPESRSSPSIQGEEDNLDPELSLNNSGDIDAEDDPFDESTLVSDNKMKRSGSVVTPGMESNRKKSRGSVAENAASTTADGMRFLGTKITEAALVVPDTRFDQCVRIVNEMKKDELLGEDSYFQIVQMLLENEQYSHLFFAMTPDLRLLWLARQGVLEDESYSIYPYLVLRPLFEY
jgi:hypothetical protein